MIPRIWLVVVTLWAAPATAGNLHSFFLGNDAAMTGGAVTPLTGDAGALWYNPAGLAKNGRTQLDISGSAFVLRRRDVPNAVRVGLPGQTVTGDVESTELVSVPTSLVFLRQVGGVNLAFGLFVPEQDYLSQVVTSKTFGAVNVEGNTVVYRYRQQIALTQQVTRYHAGPGIGWSFTPRLRAGVALFGTYETVDQIGRFWLELLAQGPAGEVRQVFTTEAEAAGSRIGAEVVVGVQWQATDLLHLGLTLVTPRLALRDSVASSALVTVGEVGPAGSTLDLDFQEVDGTSSVGVVSPVQLRGSASLAFSKGWLTVEGDLQPGLRDDDRGIDQRAVWNLRVGGRYATSDNLAFGAGLFTDHSPQQAPEEIGRPQVDFYGIAGGVELRTPLRLVESPQAESLVFSTTVGLRYALGLGTVGGLDLDLTSGRSLEATPQVEVTHHEVALHIGSAVHF